MSIACTSVKHGCRFLLASRGNIQHLAQDVVFSSPLNASHSTHFGCACASLLPGRPSVLQSDQLQQLCQSRGLVIEDRVPGWLDGTAIQRKKRDQNPMAMIP